MSNVVHDIVVEDGNMIYRAAWYIANDHLIVMAPGVTQTLALGGLPPEIGAKLIVQHWIYQGRIAPFGPVPRRAA